jgi:AraC family transcriptional regulator
MEPRIATLSEKKFIGKRINTSFARNRTFELWRSFMPRRKEIENIVGTELYSMEVYAPGFFNSFDPTAEFEKWAAVEVVDYENFPSDMQTLTVPTGTYAVFIHKGPASDGPKRTNTFSRLGYHHPTIYWMTGHIWL